MLQKHFSASVLELVQLFALGAYPVRVPLGKLLPGTRNTKSSCCCLCSSHHRHCCCYRSCQLRIKTCFVAQIGTGAVCHIQSVPQLNLHVSITISVATAAINTGRSRSDKQWHTASAAHFCCRSHCPLSLTQLFPLLCCCAAVLLTWCAGWPPMPM